MDTKQKLINVSKGVVACALGMLLLGQFSAISKDSGLNIYLFDPVIALANMVLFMLLVKVRHRWIYSLQHLAFSSFLVVGLFGYVLKLGDFSSLALVISFSYFLRVANYLVFWFILQNLVLAGLLTREFIIKLIVILGGVFCVVGFIQLLLLPDFSILDASLGWDPHKNRLASTFFDPNYAGAFICLLMAFLYYSRFSPMVKKLILLVFLVSLVLTFSRSAWGMFTVMVLVYGIFRSRKVLFISVVVFLLTIFAIPRVQTRLAGITDPADSAHFRLISWKDSVALLKKSPVIGHGFNTIRHTKKYYGTLSNDLFLVHSASGSDSSLLYVAVTSGLIGLGFFISYLCLVLLEFSRNKDIVGIGMLLGLLVQSQFVNSLFYPQILVFLFAYLAVSHKPSVAKPAVKVA